MGEQPRLPRGTAALGCDGEAAAAAGLGVRLAPVLPRASPALNHEQTLALPVPKPPPFARCPAPAALSPPLWLPRGRSSLLDLSREDGEETPRGPRRQNGEIQVPIGRDAQPNAALAEERQGVQARPPHWGIQGTGAGWGSTHMWVLVRLRGLHPDGSGLREHLEGPGWGLALGRRGEEGENEWALRLKRHRAACSHSPGPPEGQMGPLTFLLQNRPTAVTCFWVMFAPASTFGGGGRMKPASLGRPR